MQLAEIVEDVRHCQPWRSCNHCNTADTMKIWHLNIFLMGLSTMAAIDSALSGNAWGVFANMLCVGFNFTVAAMYVHKEERK